MIGKQILGDNVHIGFLVFVSAYACLCKCVCVFECECECDCEADEKLNDTCIRVYVYTVCFFTFTF